ncbi:hypothetical protein Tco_0122373 [Tanacetum coccineum]
MLAPSGGGLILYQAYDNLYAMTGKRKQYRVFPGSLCPNEAGNGKSQDDDDGALNGHRGRSMGENRVQAGFGVGGKVYTSWVCDREMLKMIKMMFGLLTS